MPTDAGREADDGQPLAAEEAEYLAGRLGILLAWEAGEITEGVAAAVLADGDRVRLREWRMAVVARCKHGAMLAMAERRAERGN